jgi:hypothetical protein
MKMLVAIVALTAAIASPALAKAKAANRSTASPVAEQAFDQSLRPDGRIHSTDPRHDVYDSRGRYISSDPDPRIRLDLLRDPPGRTR